MHRRRGARHAAWWALLGLALLGSPRASHEAQGAEAPLPRLAVIVHPDTPASDLTLAELRKLFLGDRQFWTRDLPVTLLIPAPRSPERAGALLRIYGKTETQYRHYWIAKVFRGDIATTPKAVSTEHAGELVRAIEGAITVVPLNRVPPGVKVLRLDGKSPGDGAYPLR